MKRVISVLIAVIFLAGNLGVCSASGGFRPQPNPGLDFEYIPAFKGGSITIREGWNLIAMPVMPAGAYTIRRFISDIERPTYWGSLISELEGPVVRKSEEEGITVVDNLSKIEENIWPIRLGWKVLEIGVFIDGEFRTYPREDVTHNMVPGEIYFVMARYLGPWPGAPVKYPYPYPRWRPSKTIRVAGERVRRMSYNLKMGCNGMSVGAIGNNWSPYRYPTQTISSLNHLSRELQRQNIKATSISFWSNELQDWQEYALPRPLPEPIQFFPAPGESAPDLYEMIDYKDRLIRPDEGFLLLCEENGLAFLPGRDMYEAYPPYPVECAGTVDFKEPSAVGGS